MILKTTQKPKTKLVSETVQKPTLMRY